MTASTPSAGRRIATIILAATLALAGIILAPRPAQAYSSNGVPVIEVHGFNSSSNVGCNDSSTFGTIRSYLSANGWTGSQVSVSFYNGDHNCDFNLHNENSHCSGFYDSNQGTTNEDIRHLACLLAWYIWDHDTSKGIPVKVIAHSMGGVVIRQALFDTPYMAQFPPYIDVQDVVTAGSPHQGLVPSAAFFYCGSCSQVAQMEGYNALTSNLNSSSYRGGFGQNPQGSSGTDWTNMGSSYDEVLQFGVTTQTADDGMMAKATHKVEYLGPSPQYNHGGYLVDASNVWDADCSYSDNAGSTWTKSTAFTHSIKTMLYGIEYQSW